MNIGAVDRTALRNANAESGESSANEICNHYRGISSGRVSFSIMSDVGLRKSRQPWLSLGRGVCAYALELRGLCRPPFCLE